MRFGLLVLVLAVTLVTGNVTADGTNLGPIIQLALRLMLLNLKRLGTVLITEDSTLTIPEDLKNISVGSVNLKNLEIYGFDTLDIRELSANDIDTTDNSKKIHLCTLLLLNQFGVSTNYNADIGIIDEIPIYGDGELNLAVSDIGFDLCLNINIAEDFSQLYVDDLQLALTLRHSRSYITRFWKNDSVSDLVTGIINILEKFICMWVSYEQECVKCVVSPVVQYVANLILPNEIDNELVIDCTCLQDLFTNENLLEDKIEEVVDSYHKKSMTNLLNNINSEQFKKVFLGAKYKIIEILSNEELNVEV